MGILKFLKEKAIFMIFIIIVATISFSVSLENVFADSNRVCCEKTTGDSPSNGDYCVFTREEYCDVGYTIEDVLCEYTEMCKPGCCIKDGVCESRTLKKICVERGGIFVDSENCEVSQCEMGCCTLSPSNAVFTTQIDCERLVSPYETINLEEAFDRSVETELECIQKARSMEKGCCVNSNSGECDFITRQECDEADVGVEFYPDTICSYASLGCECTEKFRTGCRLDEGYEEVWWFDSCGYPENIYGTVYGNDISGYDGKVISKEESCVLDITDVEQGGDINCGNCDYSESTICTESSDDFLVMIKNSNLNDLLKLRINHMCTDLKCYNTEVNPDVPWMDGRTRENGESWCEYEGVVGEGRDLVGSRHILHKCVNGKEIVEFCSEGRKEVCVQGEIPEEVEEIGGQTHAVCEENRWGACLAANDQDGSCELNETLDLKFMFSRSGSSGFTHSSSCGAECDIYLDSSYDSDDKEEEWRECCEKQLCRKQACEAESIAYGCYWNENFGLCLPGVPIGGFTEDDNFAGNSVQDICDIGDFTCTELWEKDRYGDDWDCIMNCDCHKRTYGTEANQFCTSLGDCGAYYNVEGVKTEGGFEASGGRVQVKDSRVGGGDDWVGKNQGGFDVVSFSELRKADNPLEGSITLLGSLMEQLVAGMNPGDYYDDDFMDAYETSLKVVGWAIGVGTLATAIGTFFAGTGNALLFFSFLKDLATFNLVTLGEGATVFGATALVAMYVVIAALIFALLSWIWTWGHKTVQVTYTFDCDPWVPPNGGRNCEKCQEYDICDEYKCKSLGADCELLNAGKAGEEVCVWANPNDVNPPIIKPLAVLPMEENDIIKTPSNSGTKGYEFKEEIRSYTDVEIGISTFNSEGNEKLSLCKISSKPGLAFEDENAESMKYYFSNYSNPGYKVNHTMIIPYLSDEVELDEDEDNIVLIPGQTNNFYVKCQNTNGYSSDSDYFIKIDVGDEPDTSQIDIEGYSLVNGAYLPAHINETDLTLFLHERASPVIGGCRWSNSANVIYENMVNNMTCSTGRVNRNSYACTGTLNGIVEGDNVFYFRCSDSAGNIHTASQPEGGFHLIGTEGLSISYSAPSGQIFANGVVLEVDTLGGVNSGEATCYYSLNNYFDVNSFVFENTGGSIHTQELSYLDEGNHLFYIWCEDSVGNDAVTEIEFDLMIDRTPPRLLRIWKESGQLKIQVDEESSCEYSNEDSTFIFGNGIAMVASDGGTVHSASYEAGDVYYIKCSDVWDPPNKMSFTVYP